MAKISAGLLMYRFRAGHVEVLLAHPGGPFFTNKDLGAWTIPKGLVDEDENQLDAARREFKEETGTRPEGDFVPLGEVLQKGGKTVVAWAFEGDLDPAAITATPSRRNGRRDPDDGKRSRKSTARNSSRSLKQRR